MRISDWSSDVCSSDLDRGRVGGDRARLSGIAFLDRGLVRPERRGGARFPDEILFVLRLEQHRAIAVRAANDRGQLARQVPDLARMKPLVVDQAQVERKSTRLNSSH